MSTEKLRWLAVFLVLLGTLMFFADGRSIAVAAVFAAGWSVGLLVIRRDATDAEVLDA